ncbi:MAG: sigma-70 family RNA polymerase sigma factor [Bacteroidales bacterium]|nr:sigma-70 family RNA polymerase sigma factor [Bacteroidales bacterium]
MQKEKLDIYNADDAMKIVEGCVKNDRQCQQILYNQTFTKMIGACLRYSSSYDEAMDFVQEGYIKVFDKIGGYQPSGSLVSWVKQIIVNNMISLMRKTPKYKFSDIDEIQIDSDDAGNDDLERIAQNEKNAARIVELLQNLTPAYRVVFNMYVVEELSHPEIAERLGISVGTSKSNLAKAKMRLKQMFIDKYGEDE